MTKHIVIDARIRRSSTGRPVARLLEQLQKLDKTNQYTVLTEPADDWRPVADNFRVVTCPFAQFSFNPIEQIKFAWQIYRLKPDLVHFTMTQQPLLYFGKIVTMTHDTTMYRFVRRGETPALAYKLKMVSYRFLVWFSHHKSNKIVVPSQTVKNEIIELQPFTKDKIEVIYEAGDMPSDLKPTKPEQVSGSFLLYVGTAFPHKNLQKMIEAFNIIVKEHPKLKLVLTGKIEKHYQDLMDWTRTQPSQNNIIFTDFVSDAELKWLYKNCEAYLFTSLSEGFGLPPLEAMAYGAPVISSNASCMPEIYGDAPLYCDASNPDSIAESVNKLLGDRALQTKMIKAGYTRLKKYSWERMAKETLIVYNKVLKTV